MAKRNAVVRESVEVRSSPSPEAARSALRIVEEGVALADRELSGTAGDVDLDELDLDLTVDVARTTPHEVARRIVRAALAKLGGPRAVVQTRSDSGRDGAVAHSDAQSGFSGSSAPLPHLDRIQASFGKHDVSHVQAFVGGPAAEAASSIGARAYAFGDKIAFRHQPDLRTAAHEAAHVVQQRSGVQLLGGVGDAGDKYERHADEVAARVVCGQSAEELLDRMSGPRRATRALQMGMSPQERAEFPYIAYQLVAQRTPKTHLVGKAQVHEPPAEKATEPKKDVGFVVNLTGNQYDNPSVIDDIAKQGWVGKTTGEPVGQRLAVVAGVNGPHNVDPELRQTTKDKIKAQVEGLYKGAVEAKASELAVPHAVFGFLWEPQYHSVKDKEWLAGTTQRPGSTSPVAAKTVENAYREFVKKHSDKKADAQKQLYGRAAARAGGPQLYLPYGLFREPVIESPYSQSFVGRLSKHNKRVYLYFTDADTMSFKVDPDVDETGAFDPDTGIFTQFSTELQGELARTATVVTGGYHYEHFWPHLAEAYPDDQTKKVFEKYPDKAEHQRKLIVLANRLDRIIREAIAKEHSDILYPTEPNLLVLARSDHEAGLGSADLYGSSLFVDDPKNPGYRKLKQSGSVFGVGATEGRVVRTRLQAAAADDPSKFLGGQVKTAYTPKASIASGVAERMLAGFFEKTKNDFGDEMPDFDRIKSEATIGTLMRIDQSYADPKTIAREFLHSRFPPKIENGQPALGGDFSKATTNLPPVEQPSPSGPPQHFSGNNTAVASGYNEAQYKRVRDAFLARFEEYLKQMGDSTPPTKAPEGVQLAPRVDASLERLLANLEAAGSSGDDGRLAAVIAEINAVLADYCRV